MGGDNGVLILKVHEILMIVLSSACVWDWSLDRMSPRTLGLEEAHVPLQTQPRKKKQEEKKKGGPLREGDGGGGGGWASPNFKLITQFKIF